MRAAQCARLPPLWGQGRVRCTQPYPRKQRGCFRILIQWRQVAMEQDPPMRFKNTKLKYKNFCCSRRACSMVGRCSSMQLQGCGFESAPQPLLRPFGAWSVSWLLQCAVGGPHNLGPLFPKGGMIMFGSNWFHEKTRARPNLIIRSKHPAPNPNLEGDKKVWIDTGGPFYRIKMWLVLATL